MKKLVVYYSLNGSTKSIAEKVCEELKADILELKPVKKIASKGIMKYIWGGKQVVFNEKPELEPISLDIDSYEFIVLGTPVWAGGYVPAINTFLNNNSMKHKRVALFCCHDGGKGQAIEKLKNSIQTANVISEIDFKKPSKDIENCKLEASKWINSLVTRLGII